MCPGWVQMELQAFVPRNVVVPRTVTTLYRACSILDSARDVVGRDALHQPFMALWPLHDHADRMDLYIDICDFCHVPGLDVNFYLPSLRKLQSPCRPRNRLIRPKWTSVLCLLSVPDVLARILACQVAVER